MAAPRRPSQPSLRGPHRGPSHPETRAQIHVSLFPPRGGRTGVGALSVRGLGIQGRTEGAAGHRADSDPRRPLPSARACARPAATPELPGPPPRGAPRASLTSRQSCSRARASSRLLSGGPRPHLRSQTPRDALRPRVSHRLPACAPPSAPRPPRGPAPAPASPLPRGVAASLPHVTREQLRPESPGRAAEGEASPPPGQGHVAPTRRARAGRRPIPATPKDGGAAQSCPEAETRPSVKMAFGRLQPPPRVTRATHLPLRPGSSPRPHSRARGERCIGWGEGKHFQKAPGFTSQQPPSIPD